MANNSLNITHNLPVQDTKIKGLYVGAGINPSMAAIFCHAYCSNIRLPLKKTIPLCFALELIYFGDKLGLVINHQPSERLSLTLWNNKMRPVAPNKWELKFNINIDFLYSTSNTFRDKIKIRSGYPDSNQVVKIKIKNRDQNKIRIWLNSGVDIFRLISKRALIHINISPMTYEFSFLDILSKLLCGLIGNVIVCDETISIAQMYNRKRFAEDAACSIFFLSLGFCIANTIHRFASSAHYYKSYPSLRSFEVNGDTIPCNYLCNYANLRSTNNISKYECINDIERILNDRLCFSDPDNQLKKFFIGSISLPRISITFMIKLGKST